MAWLQFVLRFYVEIHTITWHYCGFLLYLLLRWTWKLILIMKLNVTCPYWNFYLVQGLPYCDANKLFHILAYFKYIFKHYMYSSTPISHGQSTQVCICSLLQSLHSYNIKVLYLLLFSVTCRVFTKLLLSSGNKFVFLYILITAILNRVQLSILISILFVWIE